MVFSGIKKVAVKIGSSVLTDEHGDIKEDMFVELARGISNIKSKDIDTVLISSGAIAAGMKKLKLGRRPNDIVTKQAIAACGQSTLIWYYEKAFSSFGEKVAQILLTHDGLSSRKRFLNARKTILTLLRMGIIPIVNENDTVAVDEIMFGDNDNLAALVTTLVEADLLVVLTDTDGLFDKDPKAGEGGKLISVIEDINTEIEKIAGRSTGRTTTGGMKTKIQAARTVAAFGVPTLIVNGRKPSVLDDVFSGKEIGTLIFPSMDKLRGRKHWIAYNLKKAGDLVIDDGAKSAISMQGKSLLPSGLKQVYGNFEVGEQVSCLDESGVEVARGLTSYSSEELRKIMGSKSSQIEKILGYKYSDEIIHRDDLVILTKN